MNPQLMDILACPVCRNHPLRLEIAKEGDSGVEEGTITCEKCGAVYPIADGIPNMIPPQSR